VVVYCSDTKCQASTKASRQMDALGYRNVYEYDAGKLDWKEAGLPIEGQV
jgi:rhodanese-related sulfurtransferase